MLNQIVIVGRITDDVVIRTTKNNKKVTKIVLACPRNYKNSEGKYDTDFIPIILYEGLAENTEKYCKKGSIVGIKGKVQIENNEIKLIAEKVTFLSNSKN